MKKFTLNIEEDFELDFELIGISCHEKDFRLCYELNNHLEIDLTRIKDLEIVIKNVKGTYSLFEYLDEENRLDYYLISNRSEKGILIPEHKSIDFLLQLKGVTSDEIVEELITKICSISLVLTAYKINVNTLKSKQNLIFDGYPQN
jgi:hypothetical protein